jgi:lipopolysaccharide/colanic/teichoic acid biosynthesis glycosyltransferase
MQRTGIPAITRSHHTAVEWAAKWTMDVALASLLLLLVAPILIAAVLLIVVLDRHSPFFLDERVGLGGRHFTCLKLRTMRSDPSLLATYLATHPEEARRFRESSKVLHDPRKTKLGVFLRRSSIDEIPQLLNVLRRDMAIVGPRPPLPAEFDARGPEGSDVTLVRPGLTGLWQISGRSSLPLDERIRIDTYYAHHWSIGMDVTILLRTPVTIVSARGAF